MRALALVLLLSPAPLYSATSPEVVLGSGYAPAVAASRSRLLVVSNLSQELRGVFADFDGKPLGAPFTITADLASPTFHGVASDGRNFLVGWSSNSEMHAAIVRDDGTVQPLPKLSDAVSMEWGNRIAVAFDGTRYFLFWKEAFAHAAVISPAGVIAGTLAFPELKSVGGAAGDPSRLVVLGSSTIDDVLGTYAATVDAALDVSAPVLIAGERLFVGGGVPYVLWPAIASGPNGYFAAWVRGRTARRDELQVTPIDLTQSRPPIDLSDDTEDGGRRQQEPRVTAAGKNFVIAWSRVSGSTDFGVWAAFVDSSGTPLLTLPLSTGAPWTPFYANSPDVVGFDDGHAVVVYARNPGLVVSRSISAAPPPRRRATR